MKTLFRGNILTCVGFSFPAILNYALLGSALISANLDAAVSNSLDGLPTVSVRAVDAETTEPSANTRVKPGRVVLTRTDSPNNPLTVFISFDGSATYGLDYEKLSQYVDFAAGKTEVELLIAPFDDLLPEGDESVVVRVEG